MSDPSVSPDPNNVPLFTPNDLSKLGSIIGNLIAGTLLDDPVRSEYLLTHVAHAFTIALKLKNN